MQTVTPTASVLSGARLPALEPNLVLIAADFATCFAAAWLEEQESRAAPSNGPS